jgi:hypothetical protein
MNPVCLNFPLTYNYKKSAENRMYWLFSLVSKNKSRLI